MKAPCLSFLCVSFLLTNSHAALEIEIQEVNVSFGTDVRISWSGSLNTAGIDWAVASGTSVPGGVNPAGSTMLGYLSGGSTITLSQPGMLSPGAIAFGTGSLTNSNLFSGSPFGLDGAGRIGVPSGYALGSALEGSIRFSNQNLNTLGIDPNSSPAIWTLPSGDTITLRVSEPPPPPPPSPLKTITAPAGWDSVFIEDMSDDGTRLVGRLLRSSDFTYQCFLWSEENGFTLLDGLPGTNADSVAGISGDGNVVLGWTPSDGDVNEDRSWVYRSGTTTAVPWIGGTEYNLATALSPDGSLLVGNCDVNLAPTTFANRPATWTWNGSNYIGSSLPNARPAVTEFQNLGWLETMSGDGRYVFGKHAVSSFPATYNSYRFDLVDGSIDNLNFPTNLNIVQSNQDGSLALLYRDRSYVYLWEPGTGLEQLSNRPAEGLTGYSYRAIGMSENADRILAYEDTFFFGSLTSSQLVFWDENRERRNFIETVEAQGIDLTGWNINELDAISPDGTIMAGDALVDGARVGFLLTLPEGPLDSDPIDMLLTGPTGFFNPDDGPEITGFDADPDNDGIPNIVEIALANLSGETVIPCDPTVASNRPATTVEVDDPETPSINLTVIRRHNIPGLNVRMAVSTDIDGDWSTEGVTETTTLINETWEQVTFTAPTGGNKQFARLLVDYVP